MKKGDFYGWWELSEESGTRYDSTNYNNDLADNNTVLFGTGVIGNAADFEKDTSEFLDIVDNAYLSTGDIGFTLGGWFKIESIADGASQDLISKWGAAGHKEYNLLISRSGANTYPYFYVSNDGTASANVSKSTSMSAGTWYFIVAWHDPTANKIYVQIDNGTAAEQAHATGVYDSDADFVLGARDGDTTYCFDGLMDQAFFAKKVLTAAEKTFLYNSGNGRAWSNIGSSFMIMNIVG